MLLARLRAAHRATAGGRVRTHAAARGGRLGLTDEVKSNGKATWHPGARLFSDASLPFFVGGRILESPRRSRDLKVHGRQSKPGFHFNGNMAIMRLWQSIPASQKNLNETHKLRISGLAAETDLSDARFLPMSASGTKRTSANRLIRSASG